MADALYMVFVPGSTEPPKGPWPLDEIAKRHRAGELPDAAKVCRVGEEIWAPIASVLPPTVFEGAYEVTTDGETIVGPVTLDQIRRGLVAGKLPPDSRARLKGEGEWTAVAVLIAAKRESAATEVAAPTATPTPAAARQTAPSRSRTPLLIGVSVASVAIVTAVVLGVGASRTSSGTAATSSASATSSAPSTSSNASDEARKRAEADRATKEGEERMRLLVSEDPADWKALTEKYPGTLEAKEAAEQLAKNASLCADLDQWTKLMEKESDALTQIVPTFRSKNREATGPAALMRIASEMEKDATAHRDAMEKARTRLNKHGLQGDEEKLRLKLAVGFWDMAIMWTGYAEGFLRVQGGGADARDKPPEENLRDGFSTLIEFEAHAQAWKSGSEKLVKELRAACKKPDATPEPSDCTQCSSQEDFDVAMKKGSKCCPVMACTSDATCSGGRVCCKIPGGQLCADASRCTGSNRVQGSAPPDRDKQCRRSCPGEPDFVVNTHCYCVCMGACSD